MGKNSEQTLHTTLGTLYIYIYTFLTLYSAFALCLFLPGFYLMFILFTLASLELPDNTHTVYSHAWFSIAAYKCFKLTHAREILDEPKKVDDTLGLGRCLFT